MASSLFVLKVYVCVCACVDECICAREKNEPVALVFCNLIFFFKLSHNDKDVSLFNLYSLRRSKCGGKAIS